MQKIVKPRANNIYYCDCILHYAFDTPVLIDENTKTASKRLCCTKNYINKTINKNT